MTTATIDVAVVAPPAAPSTSPPSTSTGTGTGTTGGSTPVPASGGATAVTISLPATLGTAGHPLGSLSFAPAFTGDVATVIYKLDGKVICIETVAPFACKAKLSGADPGTHTLQIIATSIDGVVTTLERVIHIARISPKSLRVKTALKGRKLVVTGTVVRPGNVTAKEGCRAGKVKVSAGHHSSTVKLAAKCTFTAKLPGVPAGAKVKASFGGNSALTPRSTTVKAA